ncbi:MAG: glycosyltransferase N-terminal domain-containing protein [Pseudomonadota bacterium]
MSQAAEGGALPIALSAYLAISRLAGPLAPILLALRKRRGKEDPVRIAERLGHPGIARPKGPVVWLHGASVGEGMSLLPVIEALRRSPTPPFCLLTTGTVTSAQLLAPRLADFGEDAAAHQFAPVDTRTAVCRFLDRWRPDLAIWAESEFWPRLMWETGRRNIPMLLVNARLSAKSAGAWARAPEMACRLLGLFDAAFAQDDETAARLSSLGVAPGRLSVTGNLKMLLPPPAADETALADAREALGDRPCWLAASTHAPEEAAALDAHLTLSAKHPGLFTLIAPRHPDRGAEIAQMAALRGLPVTRRSGGEGPPPAGGAWILDTLGEMGVWYRLVPVVFVGGSIAPMGGHNPFEPVALDAAVLAGPSTRNFAPAYAALARVAGYRPLLSADDLAGGVDALLTDTAARATMTAAAKGAVQAALPDLAPILEKAHALLRPRTNGASPQPDVRNAALDPAGAATEEQPVATTPEALSFLRNDTKAG